MRGGYSTSCNYFENGLLGKIKNWWKKGKAWVGYYWNKIQKGVGKFYNSQTASVKVIIWILGGLLISPNLLNRIVDVYIKIRGL